MGRRRRGQRAARRDLDRGGVGVQLRALLALRDGVTLLFFDRVDAAASSLAIPLDPLRNRCGSVWHRRVPASAIGAARYYAYAVDGPFDPRRAIASIRKRCSSIRMPPSLSRRPGSPPARRAGRGRTRARRCSASSPRRGRRSTGARRRRPRHTSDTVIYELHVEGFTRAPTRASAGSRRGTFAGVIEKIPYLKELGVTVVELLPVHQYDPAGRRQLLGLHDR